MPRNQPVDWDLVAKTMALAPSLKAAAQELGLHYNTLWKAFKMHQGLCHRCFKIEPAPGFNTCAACQEAMRVRQKKRRDTQQAQGLCVMCQLPVDGKSRKYCAQHRLNANANQKRSTIRKKEQLGEAWLEQQRRHNRRQKYGEGANGVWDNTGGACSICAAPYRKRHIHIHHLDGNETNHAPNNLVVLCVRCHKLIHALMAHPNAHLTLAWFKEHYSTYAAVEPEPYGAWKWGAAKKT